MSSGEEMIPFVLVLFVLLSISEVLPHGGFLQEDGVLSLSESE